MFSFSIQFTLSIVSIGLFTKPIPFLCFENIDREYSSVVDNCFSWEYYIRGERKHGSNILTQYTFLTLWILQNNVSVIYSSSLNLIYLGFIVMLLKILYKFCYKCWAIFVKLILLKTAKSVWNLKGGNMSCSLAQVVWVSFELGGCNWYTPQLHLMEQCISI